LFFLLVVVDICIVAHGRVATYMRCKLEKERVGLFIWARWASPNGHFI
jgi:hypothetical protein